MFLGICEFLPQIHQELLKECVAYKNQPFIWNSSVAEAFESLKQAFTSAPISIHADQEKPFNLEANASDFALESVLSQPKENGLLYPIAFNSLKFNVAEINYEIHEKQRLAIRLF